MLVVQRLFYSQNDGITNSSKYQYILVKHLVARKLKAKATGWPQVKHSLWIWNLVKKKLTIHRSLTCIGMDQDTFTSVSNLVKHYRKILKCSYSLRDRGHKWLIIRTSNKQKKKLPTSLFGKQKIWILWVSWLELCLFSVSVIRLWMRSTTVLYRHTYIYITGYAINLLRLDSAQNLQALWCPRVSGQSLGLTFQETVNLIQWFGKIGLGSTCVWLWEAWIWKEGQGEELVLIYRVPNPS